MNSHPRMHFAMRERKDRERSTKEGVTQYLLFVFSAYTEKEEEKANSVHMCMHTLSREWGWRGKRSRGRGKGEGWWWPKEQERKE